MLLKNLLVILWRLHNLEGCRLERLSGRSLGPNAAQKTKMNSRNTSLPFFVALSFSMSLSPFIFSSISLTLSFLIVL